MTAAGEVTATAGTSDGSPTAGSNGIPVSFDLSNAPDQFVFASSAVQDGAFGGIAAGDSICQGLASDVGLSGIWKAILSDTNTDAIDRISLGNVVYNLDAASTAEIVTTNTGAFWVGLTSGSIGFDELGQAIGASQAWTGTDNSGVVTSANTCTNWSDTNLNGQVGATDQVDGDWINDLTGSSGTLSCANTLHLYCISQ